MKPRTLLVWPNPFHALDHEGRPAGVMSYEPTGDGVTTFDSRRFIGASLQSHILEKAIVGTAQQTMQRTWFDYLDEPVEVPESAYYKHAIARGEIFAANAETAARAGISKQTFVEAGELLERAKAEAIDAYERNPPHEDVDGLAPDTLVKFTFGPMKDAMAARKVREADAKKAEEDQKKADEDARKLEEQGVKDRAARRASRDAESKKQAEAEAEAAKNEAAAKKVAADAAAKAAEAANATKSAVPSMAPSRKGEV